MAIFTSQRYLDRIVIALLAGILVTLFVACGAGSAVAPRARTLSIGGYVVDGPIDKATVRIFAFTEGIKGTLLGNAQTDRLGFYKANIRRIADGPILVEATSGAYVEDISPNGAVVKLANSELGEQKLYAVGLLTATGAELFNVTPYTTLATGLAEFHIQQHVAVATAIAEANASIARLLGNDINIVTTRPARIADADESVRVLTKEYAYGMYAAAFSAYAKAISEQANSPPYSSFTAVGLLQIMYADIRADGLLDGKTRDLNGDIGALEYGGVALDGANYRHELGVGAWRVALAQSVGARLSMDAILNAARALAENNDPLFGGALAPPFDTDPPVFSNAPVELVNYNRVQKYVEYRVDVTDTIGLRHVAVRMDADTPQDKPAYIDNILPGKLARLYISDFSPGAHRMRVEATDLVGNITRQTFDVALPDGKPIVEFGAPLLTNNGVYLASGSFIDEGNTGIKSITVTAGTQVYNAQIDAVNALWSADLALSSGANILYITITDNQGLSREIVRTVTLDDTKPELTVTYSGAEFYRNNLVVADNLAKASATGDPLYVPSARVGYTNPTADPQVFNNAKIPFFTLRVSDNTSADAIALNMQYRINGVAKTTWRRFQATATDGALYVLPLIKQVLADDWYQSDPTDVHSIALEIGDAAGNIATRNLEFRAYFDVPKLRIASRIKQGHATAYTFVGGVPGGQVGACTTDDQGACTIRVLTDKQFLYIALNEGGYFEPATQLDAPLSTNEILTSVIEYAGQDAQVVVTPFTHLGAGLLKNGVDNGGSVAASYAQTAADLTSIYGFDVFTTVPANPNALNISNVPLSNAARYALLLAGLSEWTSKIRPVSTAAPDVKYTSVNAAQMFYQDAVTDGLLNGVTLDEQKNPWSLTLGDQALDANTYRYQLANNALTYVMRNYTLSAPAMQTVLQNVQIWATSAHAKFDGFTAIPIAAQAPSISVLTSTTTTTLTNYSLRVRVTPGTITVGGVRLGTVTATAGANAHEWTGTVRLTQQGKNTIAIRALDIAGNELLAQNADFFLDSVGPNLRMVSPGSTRLNPYTLIIEAVDGEGGNVAGVTVDGVAAMATATNQWSYTPPRASADGERLFSIKAQDELANTSTQQFSVKLDTVSPLIEVTDPVLPPTTGQRLWRKTTGTTLSYNVSDGTAPISSAVQVNGGIVLAEGAHALTVSVQIPLTLEGANTVHIAAKDGVGNPAAKDFTLYRDTLAPQLSIVTAPPAVVAAAKTSFVVQLSEANLKTLSASVSAAGSTPITGEIILDVTAASALTNTTGSLTYDTTTGQLSGSINLGAGVNTIVVKALDLADNQYAVTFNTRLDNVAPTINVTGLDTSSNTAIFAGATLSGAAIDESFPVTLAGRYQTRNNQCQLGTATNLTLSSVTSSTQNWTGTLPAQGSYKFNLTATDSVNNAATKTVDIIYDADAPVVTLGAASTSLATTTVNFTVNEANLANIRLVNSVGATSSSVTASLNCTGTTTLSTLSASNATGSLNFNLSNNSGVATVALAPGDNTISLVVTDKTGKSTSSGSIIAAIEKLSPTASIANSGTLVGNTVVTTQSALSIAASDTATGNSGITSVTFSGGGNTTPRVITSSSSGVYTDSYKLTLDGSYVYTVDVVDGVGNKTTLTPLLIRDTSAPTLTISAPNNESSTQSAATAFTVSINDGNPLPNPVTVTVKVGSQLIVAQDIPNPTAASAIGNYSFTVNLLLGDNRYDLTAVDAYNKISSTNSVNVTRDSDNNRPSVSITSNPASPTNVSTIVISGTASDANPGTVVVVDKDINGVTLSTSAAVSYAAFASPGIALVLSEGENNLVATANDTQGNSRNSSTVKVILDTIKPTVTLPTTTATVGAVSGTLTDTTLPSTITINGVAWAVNSSGQFTVSGLTPGPNFLTVTATDRAGNVFGPTIFVVNAL
ncbi:MAG: Ig-like domain-containing protein [Pseudomonadota bacterium]